MPKRNLEEGNLHISRQSREDLRLKSWKRKSSIWILLKILLPSAINSLLTVRMKKKKNRLRPLLSLLLNSHK
jgi:hypothetical protein